MQDHLKERLTGAVILVIVVVLLVPQMFRGRPEVSIDRGGSSLEGPPLRSYTIDLRDAAPVQPTATSVVAAAAPAPAQPSAAATAPPAIKPIKPSSGVRAAWAVQVGTFSRRDFAERMVKQIKAKGFTVEAVGPDDRGLYRVRSAPLAQRAAALALQQKMAAKGLKSIVNSTP